MEAKVYYSKTGVYMLITFGKSQLLQFLPYPNLQTYARHTTIIDFIH